jgi:hypothetical protein
VLVGLNPESLPGATADDINSSWRRRLGEPAKLAVVRAGRVEQCTGSSTLRSVVGMKRYPPTFRSVPKLDLVVSICIRKQLPRTFRPLCSALSERTLQYRTLVGRIVLVML